MAATLAVAWAGPCSRCAAQRRAPRPCQRRQPRTARAVPRSCAAASHVEVSVAKQLLEREGYKLLDIRSAAEYNDAHITKPPRTCFSTPYQQGAEAQFVEAVEGIFRSKENSKLLIACADGGALSRGASDALLRAGYVTVVVIEGGYQSWLSIYSTSGRPRPPPGRWVSTGTEALKSGLNVGGTALTYEEGAHKDSERLPP
eukprot:scaffold324_cov394-Prasinococcus_capsulatus_cf.AAC.32